jgi:hypothetical protein
MRNLEEKNKEIANKASILSNYLEKYMEKINNNINYQSKY